MIATTAPYSVAPALLLPPGYGSPNPIHTRTLPTPRGVNHLLGLINASDVYGDHEESAALLHHHTVGHPPFGDVGPRRVSAGGETAVIGQQHQAGQPWTDCWVRFDWLHTYTSFHTLVRALVDPRFRPGAVADFGGGRFELTQAWWATARNDSCGNLIDDRDVSVVRLLFIPLGGGVAINIGSCSFYDDPDTDDRRGNALLEGYGFTRDDVAERSERNFDCVLSTSGVHVLEEMFG